MADLHNLQITTRSVLSQPAVSPTAVPLQRLLTMEILQLPALTSLLSGEYPATELFYYPATELFYSKPNFQTLN
jgi:hypothetical protein